LSKHNTRIPYCRQLKFVLLVWAGWAAGSSGCVTAQVLPPPKTQKTTPVYTKHAKEIRNSKVTQGISAIFPKRLEIMTGNSWSSKPIGIQTIIKTLGRYDAIWGAHLISEHNRPAWRYLRRNRPDQIMLYYCHSNTTKGGNETPYFDYEYISRNFPEVFLLKDTRGATPDDYRDYNKRIRWTNNSKSGYYNRFYIDVANTDFQDWAVGQIIEMVSGKRQGLSYSYDGLAFDNVNLGRRRWSALSHQYPNWKYAGKLQQWNNGFLTFLKKIRKELNKHSLKLVANHSMYYGTDTDKACWEEYLDCVDGIFTERALRRKAASGQYYTGEKWQESIRKHEQGLQKGLMSWWMCYPSAGQRGQMEFMYSYCTWLLIKKTGLSFFNSTTKGKYSYYKLEIPWFQEYELPIGEPVGNRYQLGKCHARDYQGGLILVNPTDKTTVITLDKDKPNWDWTFNKTVSELTMPAQSGKILLAGPYYPSLSR